MAGNLTNQVRNIAEVTTAVANGDLSQKITVEERRNSRAQGHDQHHGGSAALFASEVTRVAREVGTEGKLGGQARSGVSGTWKDLTDNVNSWPATSLPRSEISRWSRRRSRAATSRRKITVDAKGEILELKDTINSMVDQLKPFAAEVTRVAREVGTEGSRRPGAVPVSPERGRI